jgi:hypothetical protein
LSLPCGLKRYTLPIDNTSYLVRGGMDEDIIRGQVIVGQLECLIGFIKKIIQKTQKVICCCDSTIQLYIIRVVAIFALIHDNLINSGRDLEVQE